MLAFRLSQEELQTGHQKLVCWFIQKLVSGLDTFGNLEPSVALGCVLAKSAAAMPLGNVMLLQIERTVLDVCFDAYMQQRHVDSAGSLVLLSCCYCCQETFSQALPQYTRSSSVAARQ